MQVFTILPIIPYTLSLATGSVGIFYCTFLSLLVLVGTINFFE